MPFFRSSPPPDLASTMAWHALDQSSECVFAMDQHLLVCFANETFVSRTGIDTSALQGPFIDTLVARSTPGMPMPSSSMRSMAPGAELRLSLTMMGTDGLVLFHGVAHRAIGAAAGHCRWVCRGSLTATDPTHGQGPMGDLLEPAKAIREAVLPHLTSKRDSPPSDSLRSLLVRVEVLAATLSHRLAPIPPSAGGEPYTAEAIVDAATKATATFASAIGTILHTTVPDTLPLVVVGAEETTRIAVQTLVEHALFHQPNRVTLGARYRGDLENGQLVFYVEVDGPRSTNTSTTEGAPARDATRDHLLNLVQSIGGHVDSESERKDQFTVWLSVPVTVPLETGILTDLPQGLTVLLVEDDPVNERVARIMLEHLGCQVLTATDGIEATLLLEHGKFDAVFMDLQMPRMDGLAATRWLRGQEGRGQHTPIIALTGNTSAEDRARCLEAGMDGHLGKPVRIDVLRAALERWVHPQANPDDFYFLG